MSSVDATDPLDIALSTREIEIIQLVAEGLTNQEIADRLTISKRTVDNHVSNVFTKTGLRNRVALLNWSMDNGKICRDGFNCCALPDADPPMNPDRGKHGLRQDLKSRRQ
ncbi:helix-turn-helix transcriptional regulator [Synechococcus sp. M16CYN]|uniref:photosynthetic electron transport-dependent transcriptional regulator PedR n=1 Tax=Synechococcus sp. M16CYN TaxID=3103139 RepID=UPI003254C639